MTTRSFHLTKPFRCAAGNSVARDADLARVIEAGTLLPEKIRTAVAESSFILDDTMRLHRVTISLGVARYAGSRKEFFDAADRALYRAKAEGKNCVISAQESP